jgi:hypothetical protein
VAQPECKTELPLNELAVVHRILGATQDPATQRSQGRLVAVLAALCRDADWIRAGLANIRDP